MLFDEIFRFIGDFGIYQISLYLMLGGTVISSGWHITGSNFLAGKMDHWCKVSALENFSFEQQKYISIPDDSGGYSQCQMFDLDFTNFSMTDLALWNRTLVQNNTAIIPCVQWQFDQSVFVSTIRSEIYLFNTAFVGLSGFFLDGAFSHIILSLLKFLLVCDREWLAPLAATIYQGGMTIGVLTSGAIADRFGRRNTVIGGKVGELVFGVACAFSPNYIIYVLMRFGVGACTIAAYTCGFVLMIESVGPSARPKTVFAPCFTSGFMLVSGLAFFIRDFRRLQFVMSACMIISLMYIFILPESARWLVTQQHMDRAKKNLQRMAEINRKKMPNDVHFDTEIPKTTDDKTRGTVIGVMKYPRMRRRCFVIFFLWFVVSMVFYGLTLNVGSLAGSIFLNNFLNAVVELPAALILILSVDCIGRRIPYTGAILLASVALLGCIPFLYIPGYDQVRTILSVVGKFGVSMSFTASYIFTAELYPTEVRNSVVGTASSFSRAAAMLAPQIVQLDKFWMPMPSVLFGGFSLVAGVLALTLPETKGKQLPETLEEGENFGRKTLGIQSKDSSNGLSTGAINLGYQKGELPDDGPTGKYSTTF